MIKDPAAWRRWEDDYIRSQPADYQENLRIFEALYEHACKLGVFLPQDPLESIEDKVRMARMLNGLPPS